MCFVVDMRKLGSGNFVHWVWGEAGCLVGSFFGSEVHTASRARVFFVKNEKWSVICEG